ncbi:sulfurtransferase [Marinobacter sp.]|uniref:sulfurtransferase n=1 Tax=Marinobacter sp. TaxID=50741 RepID=UPI00356B25A8
MNKSIVLTATELKAALDNNDDDILLIDVRDAADYAVEHIPGAVNVPDIFYHLTTTSDDELSATYQKFEDILSGVGLQPGQKAVLYEDGLTTRFGSSCRGWWLLSHLGHDNTAILDKGLAGWKATGFVTDNHTVAVTPSDFKVAVNNDIIATRDDVLAAIEDDSVVLLDNRDAREWLCEGSSPYDADGVDYSPRRGRIPTARWLEWYELLDDSDIPSFKSASEIVDILAARGIHKDDDIIIYCFKGSRASNTFAALKMAGFTRLRNYLGSWYEWSADESLPIEVAPSAAA